MSGHGRLALGAFAATLMAACAMLPLVDPVTWVVQAAFLLAVQCGVGALGRRVPLPRLLTVTAQALVMVLLLTVAFAREQAVAGVLPGPQAVRHLADLLTAGGDDVGQYAIPAPATPGIRLMLVGGVLLVGLLVDTLAVTFRSAAPAGLPLLALYSVAAGLADGAADWLWFVLAACGYLLLLLAEGRDRLSQWGRVFAGAARSRGGSSGGLDATGGRALAPVRTGRRIGVLALGIALVVPAALPALDGGLLGGTGSGGGKGGGGGTISAVNPLVSLQDNLNQPDNRQVISYRTDAKSPGDFYLRILALDRFNGNEWRASTRGLRDVPKRLPTPAGLSGSVSVTEVRSTFSASSSYRQTYLPLPYPAAEVRIGGRWRYEPEGRTLVGDDGETTGGAQYTVTSLDVQPTSEQLAGAGAVPAALLREYTEVPESLPGVVAQRAEEVTKGASNPYERAVKLQDYFASNGGFTYDTSVDSGTGTSAIARFLKDRRGFCVHFSFTMAAMARTLGIPARVAVGFTPGTAQADGSYSVGLRDAHAWPELYFEGIGWTRFEPTPTRGSVPTYTLPDAPSDDTADPARPEADASAPVAPTPSASDSCPAQMRKQGECGPSAVPGVAAPTAPGTPTGTLFGVAVAVVLVLLLPLLPMYWRLRARARRLGSTGRTAADTTARTLAVWQEINDTAWDHGIPPDEALTPRRAAERLVRLGRLDTEAADAVHRVAGAVEQVLYAPEPRPVPGLVEDARAVRTGLGLAAGRSARLRALVAPRSAVRVVWALSKRRAALTGRFRLPSRPAWARRPSRQEG
ncbi:transglutaminaseTgpA domain-containing protein [Streptomyces sp. NPDC058369]|uniref:transglutaminase family protein n=1 Tax=Streptomyces sp. NPDC058369 TaxID=3346462 RepID=UPI00366952DC